MKRSNVAAVLKIDDAVVPLARQVRNRKLLRKVAELSGGSVYVPCHVYVIEAKEVGLVKIGIAENMKERFASLQANSPIELSLFTHMEARSRAQAYEIEQKAHKLLAEFRVRGEWFKVEAEEAVKAVRKSWAKPETLQDL